METASTLRAPQGWVLLGQPSLIWFDEREFAPPVPVTPADTTRFVEFLERNMTHFGFRLRPDGASVPIRPPALKMAARHVSATTTADGRIHAVWEQEEPRDSAGRTSTALWHASLHLGKWSTPRAIFSSQQLHWFSGFGALIADGDAVYAVASYSRSGVGSGIMTARLRGTSWHVTTTAVPSYPTYVTAAVVGPDSLLVVYVASDDKVRAPNGAHLFSMLSARGGAVVTGPVRVQWSGMGNASWPALARSVATGTRSVSLTWVVSARDDAAPDSLFAMDSHDGGRTWDSTSAIALHARAGTITSSMDGRGGWHVVFRTGVWSHTDRDEVYYVGREKEAWGAPRRLDVGDVSTTPTLAKLAGDTLLLSWGRAVPSSVRDTTRRPAPVGMFALLTRCGQR